MRKDICIAGLLLCMLALCVYGCGESPADPMGTATIQFINENGDILVPETAGTPLTFTVLPGGSFQLIVFVSSARDGGATVVPVANERVTFELLTPGNGASITPSNRTDANGRTVAFYTAGNNFELDMVRVTTAAGAQAQVNIMKTGGVVGSRISALTVSPTTATVVQDQPAVITAYVTDANSNPVAGETVTFTIPVNASGAGFVSGSSLVQSISVATDPNGYAIATYYPGSESAGMTVYDTVQAALANGSNGTLVITRSAGTATTIAVAASPTSVSAGQTSIITVTLTGGDIAGVTVWFSLEINNSGATLLDSSAVTDGFGKAVVTYRAGSTSPSVQVVDTIRAYVGNISGTATVTRTSTAAAYTVTLGTPSPATIPTGGGSSSITATVKNGAGAVVPGVTVNFSQTSGTGVSPASATTDSNGEATTVFTAPGGAAGTLAGIVTASATIGGNTYSDTVTVLH